MHARTVSLAAAFFILASTAGAQQFPSQARGLGAEVAYQGGQVGRVNIFNGGLTIPLAIGQRYGVGPALSYALRATAGQPTPATLSEIRRCARSRAIRASTSASNMTPQGG